MCDISGNNFVKELLKKEIEKSSKLIKKTQHVKEISGNTTNTLDQNSSSQKIENTVGKNTLKNKLKKQKKKQKRQLTFMKQLEEDTGNCDVQRIAVLLDAEQCEQQIKEFEPAQ